MNNVTNILIVGVGGQGTLLASKILGEVMVLSGYDVKVSEVHGMSQRGGSVVTYVRYGEKVHSPIIEKGSADIIVSFEKLEAARYLSFLKKDGKMIVNSQQIDPMPVIVGDAEYPKDIFYKIGEKNVCLIKVDALSLANNAGSHKCVNTVLMGVLAKHLQTEECIWKEVIKNSVKDEFLDMNLKAFDFGYTTI